MIPKSYGLKRADWRVFNWWIVVGMSLWALGMLAGPIFDMNPPEPEYWEEFAHYDPALVQGGEIRGSVRYTNAVDCTNKARQKYFYEYKDILGTIPAPANGIDSPFIFGCQRVTRDSLRLQDIKR